MNAPGYARPIRVLLICDSYPPVLGGSEIEAQRVSAGMIRRGHQVHVLCSGGPPMPAVRDWIDPAGIPVTILTAAIPRCMEGSRLCPGSGACNLEPAP